MTGFCMGDAAGFTLDKVSVEIGDWITRQWDGPFVPLYEGGAPHLLPTCFAVSALECCGSLDRIPEDRRSEIASALLAAQRPENGLFGPGPLRRKDLSSHSATYIRMQATYFAIHALDALGTQPEHPVRFVERLLDHGYLRGWLDGGPWNNPWLHSNNIMFALTFLQAHHAGTGERVALDAFDAILDYLDERQDPETGLWQPDDGVNLENAIYAAYHFFPYYFWRGVCPAHVDRIIDSALAIQKPGGLFGREASGGACEDLDAVHTLVMMSLVSDHRASDVRAALERCFFRLLQLQQPDGGFTNYGASELPASWKRRLARSLGVEHLVARPLSAPTWRYSGWRTLECPNARSDMWGAWFRPLALRLIADRYPDLAGPSGPGRYRSIPGLGWHDEASIRTASTRQGHEIEL